MRGSVIVLAGIAGLLLRASAEGFSVDIPKSVIVAAPGEVKAAAELKAHLDLMSGASLKIVTGESESERNVFVWRVGNFGDEAAGLDKEECRWRMSRDGASLYGEGRRGALFAVYHFLEEALGVRWPSGTNVYCRARTVLTVKRDVVESGWKPTLKNREIRFSTEEGGCWFSRMRMGMHDYPRYGHAFPLYWSRFSKTNPEYFAMRRDGKRLPVAKESAGENAQLYTGRTERKIAMCVTSSGLVNRIIAEWCASGTNLFVNVCENDAAGKDVCHCEKCLALDEPPPPDMLPHWVTCYADRYVHFARRVLDRAREVRPDARVCFYAYNPSEQPPRRERLDPAMLVGLVPVEFAWDRLTDYVNGWKRMGLAEFFYRPNRHWHYRMRNLPMGSEEYFFRVFKYMINAGATGFDYDSPGAFGEAEWFRDYILAKAMQDPDKDFAHWEDHYCQAYASAAEDVKAYFRYWRVNVWPKIERDLAPLTKKGGFNVARAVLRMVGTYYSERDFEESGLLLQQALKRPELSGTSRILVERLILAHEHAVLLFNAARSKSASDIEALKRFRLKHALELRPGEESGIVDIPGGGN